MYKLSQKSLSNLVGVHPLIAFAVTEAIKVTKQDFMVFEGIRTMQKQQEYYDKGTSKTLDSYHLYGLAVDLVAYKKGPSWDEVLYPEINRAMKEVITKHNLVGIDNGFDIWGWDLPHWQLTGMKAEYDIRTIDVEVI